MEKLEIIVNGIIELSRMDVLESLNDGVVTIKGSKKSLFSTKTIELNIRKSVDDEVAKVTLNKNGNIQTLDVYKPILFDILQRTNLLDQKLNLKLDLLFNEKRLQFQDGKLIIK